MDCLSRKVMFSSVAVLSLLSVGAKETVVSSYRHEPISAETDTTMTDVYRVDSLALGFDKTGAGTLTLPMNQVERRGLTVFRVHEGKIEFTEGTRPTVEEPTDLLNLSTLWLDASVNTVDDADHVGKVMFWYDRRETCTEGVWGQNYNCVGTILSPKDSNNAVYTPTWPVVEESPTGSTRKMVYFGGLITGTGAMLRQVSTRSTSTSFSDVRHIFLVANLQNTYGFICGNRDGVVLHPSSYGQNSGLSTTYAQLDTDPASIQSRFYVNGKRYNPVHTMVKKGLQLIELHADVADIAGFGGFFHDRYVANRYGGDYIGELLVYRSSKKVLSEEERFRISNYLMQKWGIEPDMGAISVNTAAGTEILNPTGKAALEGRGVAVNTTAGEMPFHPSATSMMEGVRTRLDTTEGRIVANVREMPYDVRPGEKVTMAATTAAKLVTTVTKETGLAPGSAELIVNTNLAVRLGDLSGITNLTVKSGEVILGTASCRAQSTRPGKGLPKIYNPSFEEALGGTSATPTAKNWVWGVCTGGSGAKATTSETDVTLEWRIAGAGADQTAFINNMRADRFFATDGSKMLILRHANTLSGYLEIPDDGDYILSFDGTARYRYDGALLTLSLVSVTDSSQTNTFASTRMMCGTGFRPYAFPIHNVKKGDYRLLLETVNGRHANDTGSTDSIAIVDNFSIARANSESGGVSVPNGSFENARLPSVTQSATELPTTLATSAVAPGWSFSLDDSGLGFTNDVQVVSRLMRTPYNSNLASAGEWQLRFQGSHGRATTDPFSLPAGVWQLRCKVAKWALANLKFRGVLCQHAQPKLGVKVTINGEESVDLVSSSITSLDFVTLTFSRCFKVASTDRIVLELRQELLEDSAKRNALLNVDGIEFVPANLVKGGGFNSAGELGNWTVQIGARSDCKAELKPAEHYGSNQFEGACPLYILNNVTMKQAIDFPFAGTYRLSFWTRGRYPTTYGGDYAGNVLRASLVCGDQTNAICQTGWLYSTNFFQSVALFTVPTAGTHTLMLATHPELGGQAGRTADKLDSTLFLDQVEVTKFDQPAQHALPDSLNLMIEEGGRLRLDYTGTNAIQRLRVNGVSLVNEINAETYPEYITGPGALFVRPRGTVLILR